jgi:uncharacterized protein YprB with RNaseH-like and TPR domain
MDLEKRLYEALKLHKASPSLPRPDLFRLPPVGKIVENDYGSIWMVETIYDIGYLHGNVELSDSIRLDSLDIFDSICNHENFNFKKVAVFDTETTGLAGGTGTYPFIVGVGFWLFENFIVRQYILRDFSEEPAQLRALSDDLSNCTCLLTYNGKSFDIPLMHTRYGINRQEIPFNNYPHLDLVHPCRRIYKRHFESFALSYLETQILGYRRQDDVPSHLIPRIYFDYLQNRDDQQLLPILNHNRDDIVSLYLLAQETQRRVSLAIADGHNDDNLLLSLAELLYKNKSLEKSNRLLNRVKAQFCSADTLEDTIKLQAIIAKKTRNWDSAISLWQSMLRTGRFGIYPHVELAKHYEHRLKNFDLALKMTYDAFKIIELERELDAHRSFELYSHALKRRRNRLLKKLSK